MIRRPPRSTRVRSSAASDVYKRQRLRPRDQDLTADLEAERPELLLPDDVGNRFAQAASLNPLHKRGGFILRKLPFRMRAELQAVDLQKMHQEEFGVEPGGGAS